ncbi:MAG: porin family protein [Cytophagaceae bacterium]
MPLIILMWVSVAKGQDLSYGIKGGPNLVKVGNLDITNRFKPGFHFGFYSTFRPYRMDISITNEVNFSMKGVSLVLPDSLVENGANKYTRSFNYIDLPVILNYHISDNFYISAGIQPSLYAYFKIPSWHLVPYNKDNVSIIDFSALIGAVIQMDKIGFGVRYNHSFVPTFQNDRGRNHMFQVFLAYELDTRR